MCVNNYEFQQGKGRGPSYSTLPLPPALEHSDILQLCMWDDYHIFLIAILVFTRLLLDDIYHLIELLLDWWCNFGFCLFACWINFRFCYSYMTWETGGLELASTIILVLQANQLTKCASHLSRLTKCASHPVSGIKLLKLV